MKLSQADRAAYRRYVMRLHDIASEAHNKMADVEELVKNAKAEGEQKGEQKKEADAVIEFYEIGVSIENIAKALKITEEKVQKIIAQHHNKN